MRPWAPFPTCPGHGWSSLGQAALPQSPHPASRLRPTSCLISKSSLNSALSLGEQKTQHRAAVRGRLPPRASTCSQRWPGPCPRAAQPPGQPTEVTPPKPKPPATTHPHGDASLPHFLGRRERPQSPCPGTCQDSPPRAPGVKPSPAPWSRADPPEQPWPLQALLVTAPCSPCPKPCADAQAGPALRGYSDNPDLEAAS